ncbi:hypothetical protein OsJ_17693 [Oryza sativa Japonica Group]|uniref:Uncharacterized protein n=1 Tax=Oryza sativa subsp. japonica TaxID=39947 RepID=B9FNC2_ORYSJ|nr:hypothetical protein OsJ_17693 [Oryza sativa Japonica Group]
MQRRRVDRARLRPADDGDAEEAEGGDRIGAEGRRGDAEEAEGGEGAEGRRGDAEEAEGGDGAEGRRGAVTGRRGDFCGGGAAIAAIERERGRGVWEGMRRRRGVGAGGDEERAMIAASCERERERGVWAHLQRKGRRPLHRVLASEGLMAVATDDDEDVEEMQGYRIGRIGSASCKEDRLDQMGSAAGTRSSLLSIRHVRQHS